MATLTIRGLDERVKERLRLRAAEHGRSMEAEVRAILEDTVGGRAAPTGLGSRVHARFLAVGGVDLALPARHDPPRAADLV